MGKNGAAMRAAKMQKVVYTFTKEQLYEHDRQVAKDALRRYHDHVEKEVGKELAKSSEDDTMQTLRFLLAMCSKVLVEKFQWKKVKEDDPNFNKLGLVKFAKAVVAEIDVWKQNDSRYVDEYIDKIYKLYGVKFEWE